jgi:hypothetical protein
MRHSLPQTIEHEIRHVGYRLVSTEQLRPNRWLLLLMDPTGATLALLVQMRSLISAADVQDLASIVQLRHIDRALLWAYGGRFSAEAYRTCMELAAGHIQLCTALPSATDQAHTDAERRATDQA